MWPPEAASLTAVGVQGPSIRVRRRKGDSWLLLHFGFLGVSGVAPLLRPMGGFQLPVGSQSAFHQSQTPSPQRRPSPAKKGSQSDNNFDPDEGVDQNDPRIVGIAADDDKGRERGGDEGPLLMVAMRPGVESGRR
ncbi:hypothetical protein BJY52DRAFT_1231383 [Lactarius psammicola]|nr:hypothetical protein BJY52DRAFT_1231383 [Lactarius psammicola]